MKASSIDLKKLLCVSSDNPSKEKSDRVSYSKETLLILSRNQPCLTRPDCLSEECLGDDGKWDPEKWHKSFERNSQSQGGRKQYDLNEIREESKVVLGPQRRSFQGGCHVGSKDKPTSYSRSALSSTGSKLSDRSSKSTHQSEHEHPHLKRFHSLQNGSSDWSRKESDTKKFDKLESSSYTRKPRHDDYKRYVPPNKKYSDVAPREEYQLQYEESEPEWISYGPKSQFDTIELSGFDDGPDDFSWMGREIPMDDVPERKKKTTKPATPDLDDVKSSALEDNVIVDHASDVEAHEKDAVDKVDIKNSDGLTNGNVSAEKEVEIEEKAPSSEKARADKVEASLVDDLFAPSATPDADSNQESRFSRFFSHDPSLSNSDLSVVSSEPKLVDEIKSNLVALQENDRLVAGLQQQQKQQQQQQQQQLPSQAGVTRKESNHSSAQSNSVAPAVDLHSKDAFNRLIASLRATDKVKEQMQQRNQKMQALQTLMNSSKSPNSNCFNLSSIENPVDSGKNLQLKQHLEKQKDAYQQKMRQIEQKQKSSANLFPNNDMHSLQLNKSGLHPGFSMQNSSGQLHDSLDERAAATASLAAKLAHKGSKDDFSKLPNSGLLERLYAKPGQTTSIMSDQNLLEKDASALLKLQRMHSAPETSSKSKSFYSVPGASSNNLTNNSLAIAQMLTSAGVTEEQLKQLTLEQQELIITMVQNQYTQKDIGKLMNLDGRNSAKLPDTGTRTQLPVSTLGNIPFVSSSKDLFSSKSLPGAAVGRLKSAPTTVTTNTSNPLSFLTDSSTALSARSDASAPQSGASPAFPPQLSAAGHNTQARLFPHSLMTVQPAAIVSPVVPLVSPSIAPRMLAPHHLTPLAAAHHPAYQLLQLQQQQQQQQQQQVYANQLAQQQQAVFAALQKQQLNAAQVQQSLQNIRLGSSLAGSDTNAGERSHFNNPLAQWFSSDVLRQSQFPPVSPLTGQQTMKLSSVPRGVESIAHNAKQH